MSAEAVLTAHHVEILFINKKIYGLIRDAFLCENGNWMSFGVQKHLELSLSLRQFPKLSPRVVFGDECTRPIEETSVGRR